MKKFLLTAIFAVLGSWAFAQERIAVFPFEILDNAVTLNESFQLYRSFSNEFTNKNSNGLAIVPRQDVDRLINTEAAFQLTDFSAQIKTAEMMRVQNATQILSGTIGKIGNSITIIVSLYTYPELDQLPGGASLRANTAVELFDKIPELVQSMYKEITNSTTQPVPEGFLYEIINGRTVTITGYNGNAAILNIPSQIDGLLVTSIGERAFYNYNNITSVIIPPSVTSIGEIAFFACHNLTSVIIPSSVTVIGEEAFRHCESLTSVIIPSSVMTIGSGVFDSCNNLISITVDNRNTAYASIDGVLFDKNIKTLITYPPKKNQRTYIIPSSVMSIGSGAFSRCSILTSVTIPSSVSSIGFATFYDCRTLISVTIPSSVTSIGGLAFWGCGSLTSVTIPSSVTSIGESAFLGCTSLASITIPSSVRSIGIQAFSHCISLTSVTIPSLVTSIGDYAFFGCESLTSVTLSRRTRVGEDTFPSNVRITYRD